MLTAKDEIMDKVMGLDIGAEDYMTKPFAIEELLARIRVVFKHKSNNDVKTNDIVSAGNLQMDIDRHVVTYENTSIDLTKKEFDLLKYLMINKDIALSRENILDKVWGYDYLGDTNIVDVYIRYLRSKIDDKFNIKYIYTIRGVGYQFRNE
jgi:DNA-binding response OmpR family regulator